MLPAFSPEPEAQPPVADPVFLQEDEFFPSSTDKLEEPLQDLVNFALNFLGTPYDYGGMTKEGMDCSGLIRNIFEKQHISLPRRSRDMALTGKEVELEEARIGDLLFFETNPQTSHINHVGMVIEIKDHILYFIHSTTSRGVIISSMLEPYWKQHFTLAKRVLESL